MGDVEEMKSPQTRGLMYSCGRDPIVLREGRDPLWHNSNSWRSATRARCPMIAVSAVNRYALFGNGTQHRHEDYKPTQLIRTRCGPATLVVNT
jgi:hypothetical protein